MRASDVRNRLVPLTAAVLIVLGCLVAAAGTAYADESTDLLNDTIHTDRERVALVSLGTDTFGEGERRFLEASYEGHNPQSFNIMQGARITCRRTSDDAEFHSVWSTRNILPGTDSSLEVRFLFVAPTADDYACTLWGHSTTSRGEEHRLEVRSGRIAMDVDARPDGAEWRHTSGGRVTPGEQAYLLRKEWTATEQQLSAYMDFELTNDYGKPSNGKPSEVEVRMYVTQLTADGKRCREATVESKRVSISALLHHEKIYLAAKDVTVSNEQGCTKRFAIKGLVVSVSGNPVFIEGKGETSHYTNAIAFSHWAKP